jgi:hypothetical protein
MRVVFKTHQARKYLLSALGLLATILAVYYLLVEVFNVGGAMPQIEIRGYEVVLFQPNSRPFVNVLIENTGGDGTITVYSSAGFALPTFDAHEIKRQLEHNTDVLVDQDLGGREFAIEAQEQQSFTVNGPALTPEQTRSLNPAELNFYFSGTILIDGGEAEKKFCSFVAGNKPNDPLPCPEN